MYLGGMQLHYINRRQNVPWRDAAPLRTGPVSWHSRGTSTLTPLVSGLYTGEQKISSHILYSGPYIKMFL